VTPSVAQLLRGVAATLATPLPPEAGPAYTASRVGMVSSLAALCIQESEKAVPVRLWENTAIRAVLAEAAGAYPEHVPPPSPNPPELGVSALDTINADLRRRLIGLHETVEAARDQALDHKILRLYREMAQARRLTLGG
jgi:hypothetical protein